MMLRRLAFLSVMAASCSAADAPPIFAVTENGAVTYIPGDVSFDVPLGKKHQIVISSNHDVAFCATAAPVNDDAFYFPGHYLFAKTGVAKAVRIASSTGSVCSISDYWWTTKLHLAVLLQINHSVQELRLYEHASEKIIESYQGSHFVVEGSSETPIYVGLRPPGTPREEPETLYAGMTAIATLAPRHHIHSNILLSTPTKNQIEVNFIVRPDEGDARLGTVSFNLERPAKGVVHEGPLPEKRNPALPTWHLRYHDGKIISD